MPALALALLAAPAAPGQAGNPAAAGLTTPVPAVSASPTATPTVPAIPLPQVVTRADADIAQIGDVVARLTPAKGVEQIDQQLPTLANELDARIDDTTRLLEANPSLEALRVLEADWRLLGENLPAWRRDLTTRATRIEAELGRLAALAATWEETRIAVERAGAPLEIQERTTAVLAAIGKARSSLEASAAQALSLQSRVAEQETRSAAMLNSVRQRREARVGRLLFPDSPPLWSDSVRTQALGDLLTETRHSLTVQDSALVEYARRRSDRFVLHGVLVVLLAFAFFWARDRMRPWVLAEPALKSATRAFDLPIAAGLLLSILVSSWIYPQAPRMLRALLGAAALLPAILILRGLVERKLHPILNALMAFYFADRVLYIAQALPLVSRVLFLAEMLAAIAVINWLFNSRRSVADPGSAPGSVERVVRAGARLALPVLATAVLANVLGYVALSRVLGTTVLNGAYLALILHVAVEIVGALLFFGLRVRPLALLKLATTHAETIRQRGMWGIRWLARIAWLWVVLELLSIRDPVLSALRLALGWKLNLGSIHVSAGDAVAFVVVVWLAFALSRFLLFVLEEDVYPRLDLGRGVPYALSTMLRYLVLLLGFLVALGALGLDLSRFAVLAGALGVGIGFGLQSVVNNFVSGLILLFERPVNVGDVLELGARSGELQRIGLRTSVLRSWDGSEIVVPNSKLTAEEVVNWTLTDRQRRLDLNVGVDYAADPATVITLLQRVAGAHPDILQAPAPQALFIGFGDNSLDFTLRVWTLKHDRWQLVRSEILVAIHKALGEAGITIPFPQRDLHLKSVAPEVTALWRDGSGQP